MPASHRHAPGALALLEEGVALLRTAPAATLLSYYLGALPFVLGLLWFWTSLSSGTSASQRLPAAALGMTALFAWMKTWQAVFARQLLSELCGDNPGWPGLREMLRLATIQLVLQPPGLLLQPLALVALPALPQTWAFFQSATALAARREFSTREVFRQALREAWRWPWQNVTGLVILLGFGFFVFLNVASGALALAQLLKTLLGIETTFSRSLGASLNTTTLLMLVSLTWLCLDPLSKTFYVLRCFHGDALRSGQDLRAQLRRLAAASGILLVCLLAPPRASAATNAAANQPAAAQAAVAKAAPGVAPATLDQAITETLRSPDYDWRGRREPKESDKNWLVAKLEDLRQWLAETFQNALDTLRDWLRKLFTRRSSAPGGGLGAVSATRVLMVVLIVVLAVLLVVAIMRAIQQRRSTPVVAAQAIAATPDLTGDDVHADQLPSDGWARLAADLIERGELRLALRALYLGSLALLADRGLLTLQRFKSNLDYQRELNRRAHALPGLAERFATNTHLVDRVWYGRDEVSRETVDRFAQGVNAMRAGGQDLPGAKPPLPA